MMARTEENTVVDFLNASGAFMIELNTINPNVNSFVHSRTARFQHVHGERYSLSFTKEKEAVKRAMKKT